MHMNSTFLVERTMLTMSLAVVVYDVGVVTSPGNFIRFPPTVSLVQCVSDFCGCILAIIIP